MQCGRTLVTAFMPEIEIQSEGSSSQGRWEHTVRFSPRSVTHGLNTGNRVPPSLKEAWSKKPCWDFGQSKRCHSSWLTPCFYGNTGECLQRPHAQWYLSHFCQSCSILPRKKKKKKNPADFYVTTHVSLFGYLNNTKL